MSDWFRGTIEGAYVGTPARVKASTPLEVSPFDITLYRASISAIERIPPPDDEVETSTAALDPTTPEQARATPTAQGATSHTRDAVEGDTAQQRSGAPLAQSTGEKPVRDASSVSLRQAELNDVVFLGVGSDEAKDHHAAYDLRITDVRLLNSTESEGRLYGRLVGTVVGSLSPNTTMVQEAQAQHRRVAKRRANVGAWVESLRWVMIALAAWLAFGLCGGTAGTLWLAVVLPSALLRVLVSGVLSPSHGARVFGWALVLASATLGGLLYYRVTTLECQSALWWLSGMALAVLVSSVLPSRYPFFWTKIVLAGSTLCLCAYGGSTCQQEVNVPSVISQGPRTDPDGRWPKDPGRFDDIARHQSREFTPPISLPNALSLDPWPTLTPPVVHLPLNELLPQVGALNEAKLEELGAFMARHSDRTIVLEVHGNSERASSAMSLLEAWIGEQFETGYRIQLRAAGSKFPIVPTDSPEALRELNNRLEIWLEPD